MTEEELQKLVENVSLQDFKRPFKHLVKINYRFTTTGGRYHLNDHHLEINAHFLPIRYRQDLIGIIKHELTHYHLHLLNKGYRHRDADFRKLLKMVGGSRYTPDIGLRRKNRPHYLYLCQNCGQSYYRIRQVDVRRFHCGKCGGVIFLVKNITRLV